MAHKWPAPGKLHWVMIFMDLHDGHVDWYTSPLTHQESYDQENPNLCLVRGLKRVRKRLSESYSLH
jgi:hypothetical protein